MASLGRRTLIALVTMILTVSAVILALRVLPGDAAVIRAGLDASPEMIAQSRRQLRLHGSVPEQFIRRWGELARGDLGTSLRERRPVSFILAERVETTLSLTVLSALVALSWGIPLGLWLVARRRNPLADAVSSGIRVLMAAPSFWLALLLALLFVGKLGWLPLLGYQPLRAGVGTWFHHLALPVLTLSLGLGASLALQVRALLLELAAGEFVRTALAKGVSKRQVLFKHVLRLAVPGLATLVALQVGGLLTGVIVIESVFSLPGLGLALLGAVAARDYPVVEAVTFFAVIIYALVNLVADVVGTLADPRAAGD